MFSFSCTKGAHLIELNEKEITIVHNDDYLILSNDSLHYGIEQVTQLADSHFNFQRKDYHYGTQNNLWLKLRVRSTASCTRYFFLGNHEAGELIFFQEEELGKFKAVDTVGTDISFYQRNIMDIATPVFEIELKPGVNTFYIKYHSTRYLGLYAELYPPQQYINSSTWYTFRIGGFFFLIVFLILYNLLFYFSTKDRVYLYYIFYVLTAFVFCAMVNQLAFATLWPDQPQWNDFFIHFKRPLFLLALVLYSTYFLKIGERNPLLNKIIWGTFALFAFGRFYCYSISQYPYELSLRMILVFTILSLILYCGFQQLKEEKQATIYFLTGFMAVFVGTVVTFLNYYQIIQGSVFVYYVMYFAVSIDVLMFSLSLSARLRKVRIEKERALQAENEAKKEVIFHLEEKEKILNKVNAELESKVLERTQALQKANDTIQNLNTGLHKENWQLNKEIKHINTARVLVKNQSYQEVLAVFPDKTSCYQLISSIKWADGFQCRKCHSKKAGKGTQLLSKRCTSCGTIESVTANTIFHRLKIPIEKAFYLAYVVFNQGDTLNLSDVSRELDLNYQACLRFKTKVETAIRLRRKQHLTIKSWEDIILEV